MQEFTEKQAVAILSITGLTVFSLCAGAYLYMSGNNQVISQEPPQNTTQNTIVESKSKPAVENTAKPKPMVDDKQAKEAKMAEMVKQELDKIQNVFDEDLNSDINYPKQVKTVKEYEQKQQSNMPELYDVVKKPIENKIPLYYSPYNIDYKTLNEPLMELGVLEGWELPEDILNDITSFNIKWDKPASYKSSETIDVSEKMTSEVSEKKFKLKNPEDITLKDKQVYNLVLYISRAYNINFDLSQQLTEQSFVLGKKYNMQPTFLLSFICMQIKFYQDLKIDYYKNNSNIEKDVKKIAQLIKKYNYTKDMTPVIMEFNTMYKDTAKKFNNKIKEAYNKMSQVVDSTSKSAQ